MAIEKRDYFLIMEGNRLYIEEKHKAVKFKIDITPVYYFLKGVFEHDKLKNDNKAD